MIPNAENLNLLYEQADVNLTFNRFLTIVGGLAVVGAVIPVAFRLPIYVAPLGSAFLAVMPFVWLLRRKSRRIRQFVTAMPEAVELISRACGPATGWPRACAWSPRR